MEKGDFDFDLGRPELRSYSVSVKSIHTSNIKSFSLYSDKFSIQELYLIIKYMLMEERDKYLDFERRYYIDDLTTKVKTHLVQIFQYKNNKVQKSISFCFVEKCYSANEIADRIEMWFKQNLRKQKKLSFEDGIVKETIEKALNNELDVSEVCEMMKNNAKGVRS